MGCVVCIDEVVGCESDYCRVFYLILVFVNTYIMDPESLISPKLRLGPQNLWYPVSSSKVTTAIQVSALCHCCSSLPTGLLSVGVFFRCSSMSRLS